MKTWLLARIMWLVGLVGWFLLGTSLVWCWSLQLEFTGQQAGTLEFLAMMFGGAFLVGLSQAWLGLFSVLSDRALRVQKAALVEPRIGWGRWVALAGFFATVALVAGVMLASAAPPAGASTFHLLPPTVETVLLAGLVLLLTSLAVQSRWIGRYRERCVAANGAPP